MQKTFKYKYNINFCLKSLKTQLNKRSKTFKWKLKTILTKERYFKKLHGLCKLDLPTKNP